MLLLSNQSSLSMNDNDAYIVQCTRENFEDAKYLLQVFCRILEVDARAFSFRTCALDSMMKRRLDEIGAGFWPVLQGVTVSKQGKG